MIFAFHRIIPGEGLVPLCGVAGTPMTYQEHLDAIEARLAEIIQNTTTAEQYAALLQLYTSGDFDGNNTLELILESDAFASMQARLRENWADVTTAEMENYYENRTIDNDLSFIRTQEIALDVEHSTDEFESVSLSEFCERLTQYHVA